MLDLIASQLMVLDGPPDMCCLLQKAIDVIDVERRVGEEVTIEK
jgi:hypothetical protein